MKTKQMFFLFLFFVMTKSVQLNAQVSIGGNPSQPPQPFSILELISGNSTVTIGGLRLPQLSQDDKAAIYSKLIGNDKSKGLFIYNMDSSRIEYWNGIEWVVPGSGNAAGEMVLPWQIAGPDATRSLATATVTDSIFHKGAVNIGASTGDPSAILDVQADNQGVLMPRVALDSATDVKTIPNPAIGLLVYNTGNKTTFPTEGYLFWDGMAWKLFANASSAPGSATLHCEASAINPNQQIMDGEPLVAGTLLQVPYSGSNGGNFKGVTLTSTNGGGNITAEISSGTLSLGNGVLSFLLTGTPTIDQQAPNGIQFNLADFTAANPGIMGSCGTIQVGNILNASIQASAVMGYLTMVTDSTGNDSGTKGYVMQCNSPDGKFSIRVRVPDNQTTIARGNQWINIQVRNNMSDTVRVIWNYQTTWSGGNVQTANVLNIPPQVWGGNNSSSGPNWYNATDGTIYNGGYWGNIGIYDGNGPEYRRYTWIPMGPDNKVAYEARVMAALDTTTPTIAVVPTLLKVFIRFEEVIAE